MEFSLRHLRFLPLLHGRQIGVESLGEGFSVLSPQAIVPRHSLILLRCRSMQAFLLPGIKL